MYDYYLSHQFDSRHKMRDWQLYIQDRTGIVLINPFYDTFPEEMKLVDVGQAQEKDLLTPAQIIENDLKHIQDAKKGLIAIIDGASSYGTIQEIVYAKTVFDKQVISIITNNKHDHPWLKYHSDQIFTSFEDFENWLIHLS